MGKVGLICKAARKRFLTLNRLALAGHVFSAQLDSPGVRSSSHWASLRTVDDEWSLCSGVDAGIMRSAPCELYGTCSECGQAGDDAYRHDHPLSTLWRQKGVNMRSHLEHLRLRYSKSSFEARASSFVTQVEVSSRAERSRHTSSLMSRMCWLQVWGTVPSMAVMLSRAVHAPSRHTPASSEARTTHHHEVDHLAAEGSGADRYLRLEALHCPSIALPK